MTAKAFTPEALAAIRTQRGALFDAIVNAYIAANLADPPDDPNIQDDDDENGSRPAHVPTLLKNVADPYVVHLVYVLYEMRLPTYVVVSGHRIRILEPEENLVDRAKATGSFSLIFGGMKGWVDLAMQYQGLGHDRQQLERLAVRWLQGDWHNAEFFNECQRVPGFDRQLRAATAPPDGELGDDEDMLHLAGYKQMREEYARDGGNPNDLDEMTRAFFSGDQKRYRELRRKVERGGGSGCLSVILLFIFVSLALILPHVL
jgi:hypothetical protein